LTTPRNNPFKCHITNMKDKNWNPDEWQGRSKRNVETSYKLTFITVIGLIVTFFVAAIIG